LSAAKNTVTSLFWYESFVQNVILYFTKGDQIGQFFFQLDYFWRLIMIFWKDEVAQNNGDFLGDFLYKQIYYIFT